MNNKYKNTERVQLLADISNNAKKRKIMDAFMNLLQEKSKEKIIEHSKIVFLLLLLKIKYFLRNH
jgi:hypothetical protein